MKNTLSKITASIFIPFSGFYLVGENLISPIYIVFCLSLYFIPIIKIHSRYIIKDSSIIIVLGFVAYLLLTQIFLEPQFGSVANVLLGLIYFVFSILILYKLKIYQIVNIAKIFIYFSIILLIGDTLWRLTHPVFVAENGADIRDIGTSILSAYKEGSFIFEDSNFASIYALCVLFLNHYLIKEKLWENKLTYILTIIIILFTFSKAAIITALLSFILLPILISDKKLWKRIVLSLLLTISTVAIFYIVNEDSSFQSKFRIVELAFTHLTDSSFLEVLFGIGYGNAVEYLGIGAHNLYVLYLIESGIIGLCFFLFIQLVLLYKSNKQTLYITLPLLIIGFSLVGHAIPFYYASIALIYILNKKKLYQF